MKLRLLLLFSFLVIISSNSFSQITNQELGRGARIGQEGLYDFSDPGAINIKVSVWGYVSRPGKYIIPDYSTVIDLLSFAGGPSQDSQTDDLRIYRKLDDGTETIFKFSFDDIMWGDGIEVKHRNLPHLKPGDIMIVPGSPRLFFTDWFRIGLEIFSAVISIVSLVILIQRY